MSLEIEQRFTSLDNAQALALANYPGVYFLCQGSTVVYVGKSNNIARRIATHFGSKDFDTVMMMRVPDELLASVEMHWIQRLKPKLNISLGSTRGGTPGRRKLGKSYVCTSIATLHERDS